MIESPRPATARDEPTREGTGAGAQPATVDDAIRTAAKLAIDACDVERARALLDLLAVSAKPHAPVVVLDAERAKRR